MSRTVGGRCRRRKFFSWSIAFLVVQADFHACSAGRPPFSNVVQSMSRRGHMALARSVPALSVFHAKEEPYTSRHHQRRKGCEERQIVEVAVKEKKRKRLNLPSFSVGSAPLKSSGFYYGITSQTLTSVASGSTKRPKLSESMYEALEELRIMRKEMESMRKEMEKMKRKMIADGDMEDDSEEAIAKIRMNKRRRARESEKLAVEIEEWALKLLKETEEDGWQPVACNKMMRKTLNPTGRTQAYLKWMRDSRGDKAEKEDETEYPCIKCVATIDAPLEDVCTYLSQESASPDYNDVVHKYKDVDEISPNAKICWSQSPQILFLKPRDFVTFCHHRWKGDGSEVIVNQATEHPDYPATTTEKEGNACRAYALRGANFFERDPDDPEKTIIHLIAHANPGGGVPQWAAKTAVNALAPIEPFKLFQKINENVLKNQPQLREHLQQAEMVGTTLPNGRSSRPAGMAQMGYACFWPEGGGVYEGARKKVQSPIGANETSTTNSSNHLSENGLEIPSFATPKEEFVESS